MLGTTDVMNRQIFSSRVLLRFWVRQSLRLGFAGGAVPKTRSPVVVFLDWGLVGGLCVAEQRLRYTGPRLAKDRTLGQSAQHYSLIGLEPQIGQGPLLS